ncbi:MAG: HAD family hydrolase [Paracoccaceae bacterium]
MPDQLLIFDCDGVLVDSELISLGLLIDHCAAHGLRLNLEMACDCFLGKPVATASGEANRIHKTSVPDVDLDAFQQEIIAEFEKHLQPVNGIADALGALSNPKCVASSSNMKRIEMSLNVTGLNSYFDGRLFSTDMVARGKPHPDVFLHAAQEMGFETSAAIVIEDSPAGLQAAKAAQMKTIAYVGGSHASHANLKAMLDALSPDVLIDDMADLSAAIKKLS